MEGGIKYRTNCYCNYPSATDLTNVPVVPSMDGLVALAAYDAHQLTDGHWHCTDMLRAWSGGGRLIITLQGIITSVDFRRISLFGGPRFGAFSLVVIHLYTYRLSFNYVVDGACHGPWPAPVSFSFRFGAVPMALKVDGCGRGCAVGLSVKFVGGGSACRIDTVWVCIPIGRIRKRGGP